MQSDFAICDYGASSDEGTINTAAIQAAIDACHGAGGGRVVCGHGDFVTGSLMLKSNVELHLEAGCRLVGSKDLADYEDFAPPGFRPQNAPEGSSKGLVRAVEAEGIAITGPGEINGCGLAFYNTNDQPSRFFAKPITPRPFMVMFYKCRNVRIEGTSFIDSPCWTFWLMKCERVHIHRAHVAGDQRMINNDGIDIDSCRDVTVSDCVIRTGDDCVVLRAIRRVYDEPGVCENVTVTGCVLDSWCQGVRVGCPGDNVVRNCTLANLVIKSRHNGILFENPKRYLPQDGRGYADVSNILFSNIVIDCARMPIAVLVEDGIALPRLAGLSFANFRIRSGLPCTVAGSPETTIRDISFSNMVIETTGDDAIVCRHCEGVKMTNVVFSNRQVTGA